MKKDFVHETALQSAADALKQGKATVKEAKAFAKDILDLSDKYSGDIPSDGLFLLKEKFPKLAEPFIKTLKDEARLAEKEAVMELRHRIKKLN